MYFTAGKITSILKKMHSTLFKDAMHLLIDDVAVAIATAEKVNIQTFIDAVAAGAATVLAAETLVAGAHTKSSGFAAIITPRVLSITGAMAGASLTGDVVINGTDIDGNVIANTIALNNNATVVGTKAFKSVTSIVFPARVTAADTVAIGVTDKLGLSKAIAGDSIFMCLCDGVQEAHAATFDSADVSKCTVDPNSALNGAKDFTVYFYSA